MAIYKTKWFTRWANKQNLDDQSLCDAVREMQRGLFDADLGGSLFKKRVARKGQGKRGGFRTLVATKQGGRWVFLYGFPKNERSNIDRDEEAALKNLGAYFLTMPEQAFKTAVSAGELFEVNCDEENEISDS